MAAPQTRPVLTRRRPVSPEHRDRATCKFCASADVIKNGTRKGTQYWQCKRCGRGFVNNQALPKKKYTTTTMFLAANLYFASWPMEEIRRAVRDRAGLFPSESTVYAWIRQIIDIGIGEGRRHRPLVGDTWIAGETPLEIRGKSYWLLDLVDCQTHFVVAARISRGRGINAMLALIQTAVERASRFPKMILANNRWTAHVEEVRSSLGGVTPLVLCAPSESNGGQAEAWHHFLDQRRAVVREFKALKTARRIVEGALFSYNFLTRQSSLAHLTPAEAAGIDIPFKEPSDVAHRLYAQAERAFDWEQLRSIAAGPIEHGARTRPGRTT